MLFDAVIISHWHASHAQVSDHVWIEREDLDALDQADSLAAKYLAHHCRPWLERFEGNSGYPGFCPFDSLAVGVISHPELLHSFRGSVHIEEGPDETRMTGTDSKPHLLVDEFRSERQFRGGRVATYFFEPTPEFKPMLMERLAQ